MSSWGWEWLLLQKALLCQGHQGPSPPDTSAVQGVQHHRGAATHTAYPEPNLPTRPAGIPGIPTLCFSTGKPDFLAVPAHTPQKSPASDRPRGMARKAGVKDLH